MSKGKRGEREACDELQPTVDSVAKELGMEAPRIRRNLQQSGDGGEDLIGLPWYSIEVKRCETLNLAAWWRQCVTQARRKAATATAWDDLRRGGWRRVEAAMAPRDARGGGDEAPSRETGVVPLPWLGACGGVLGAPDDKKDAQGGACGARGGVLGAPDDGGYDQGGAAACGHVQGGAAACGHVARVPVLMYRQARRPWMVRTRVQAATVGGGLVALDVELLLADWLAWLAVDLRGRLEALQGR